MYDMSVSMTISSDPSGLRNHVQVLNPDHSTQRLGPIADRLIPRHPPTEDLPFLGR
jgi:hypothetical protein